MEINPYEAPLAEGELISEAPPRNVRAVLWCFGFAALFAVMFVGTLRNFDGTLGNAVAMGWSFVTSLGCFGMGWGLVSCKRWPAIAGACLALIALATMFTVVIGFPNRLGQAIGG